MGVQRGRYNKADTTVKDETVKSENAALGLK